MIRKLDLMGHLAALGDSVTRHPPATAEAIAAVEGKLGASLPEELRAFYASTNGVEATLEGGRTLRIVPVERLLDEIEEKVGSDEELDDEEETHLEMKIVRVGEAGEFLLWLDITGALGVGAGIVSAEPSATALQFFGSQVGRSLGHVVARLVAGADFSGLIQLGELLEDAAGAGFTTRPGIREDDWDGIRETVEGAVGDGAMSYALQELYKLSDGGRFEIGDGVLEVFPAAELVERSLAHPGLAGMLAFGRARDHLVFSDPKGLFLHGKDTVFVAPESSPKEESARLAARSGWDLLQGILAGKDILAGGGLPPEDDDEGDGDDGEDTPEEPARVVPQLGHNESVRALFESEDGGTLVTLGGADGVVRVWSMYEGVRRVIRGERDYSAIAVTPDFSLAVLGDESGRIELREVATGALRAAFEARPEGRCLSLRAAAISPDGRRAAIGGIGDGLTFLDLERATLVRQVPMGVQSMTFTPDGEGVVVCGGYCGGAYHVPFLEGGKRALPGFQSPEGAALSPDGTRVAVWEMGEAIAVISELASGRELLRIVNPTKGMTRLAWSPDGGRIVTGDYATGVAVFDSTTGAVLHKHDSGPGSGITSLAVSPDGDFFVAGRWGRYGNSGAFVIDLATGERRFEVQGHGDTVSLALVSRDGSKIFTGSSRGVRIDARDGESGWWLARLEAGVATVAVSPDGRRIVTGDCEGVVRLWSASDFGRALEPAERRAVTEARFTPDGRFIVATGYNRPALVHDAVSGAEVRRRVREHGFQQTRPGPGGSQILTASHFPGTAEIWDAASGEDAVSVMHSGIQAIALSEDGSTLVTSRQHPGEEGGERPYPIFVHDARTGALRTRLLGHGDRTAAVLSSADGSRIASVGARESLRVWDAASGREVFAHSHGEHYPEIAFSRDGTRVALATGCPADVYDVARGVKVCTADADAPVQDMLFTPDGAALVTRDWYDRVCVWDASTGARIHRFDGHMGRGRICDWTLAWGGRLLVTASADGSARLLSLTSGQEVAALYAHEGGAAILTPDGRFDVRGDVSDLLRVWRGDEKVELVAVADRRVKGLLGLVLAEA